MNLTTVQSCPYCNYEVDETYSEWEEGTSEVDCSNCGETYSVTTHYKFLGFEIEKVCKICREKAVNVTAKIS